MVIPEESIQNHSVEKESTQGRGGHLGHYDPPSPPLINDYSLESIKSITESPMVKNRAVTNLTSANKLRSNEKLLDGEISHDLTEKQHSGKMLIHD